MLTLAVLLLIAMVAAALGIHTALAPLFGSFISWAIAVAATVSLYTWMLTHR